MDMNALLNYQNDLSSRILKARVNYKKSLKQRITKYYLENRLESLDQLWCEFRDGHKELLRTSDMNLLKAKAYITEEMYDNTEEEYTDYKCELKEGLSELVSFYSCQSRANDEDAASFRTSLVKLPKLSIPSFSGKYHEWTTFRDLFLSMIHNNDSLDSVQKMQYLKSYLTGEAEQLLRNIPVSETNYARCWSLLEQRYNNKKYLSHCILKRLLSQKSATTESSGFLKDLMDTSTDCLSALSNLGIDVSTWDIIVIHLLTLKLDPESRKQWELNVATNSALDALPTFNQFKDFLTSRYRALEFIEPGSVSKAPIAYEKSPNSSFSRPNVLHVASAPALACEYCNEPHKLCFCKAFASEDYTKRHEFVTNNRICYNCLGSNHTVRFCQKTTSCRICNRKHHSLLHPRNVSISTANLENVDQAAETVSGEATHIITENTQTETTPIVSCFTKGIVRDDILLATALVKAESKTGDYQVIRALLDQGSQASFVTEAVVQALGIKKIPVKRSISGLGGDQTSVGSKYIVELKVQSLTDPSFNTVLKAYVLDKITAYLPGKKVAAPEWFELQQLNLADPTYKSPNKIDVLLGAEVYCEILKDGVLKGPNGCPVAQCTTLGWILSGPVSSPSTSENVTALHSRVSVNKALQVKPSVQTKSFIRENKKCGDMFASSAVRDEKHRDEVKFPVRDNDPTCKGNKKFRKNETYTKLPVTTKPGKNRKHAVHLPHHVKTEKPSEQVSSLMYPARMRKRSSRDLHGLFDEQQSKNRESVRRTKSFVNSRRFYVTEMGY